jgi:release factor glutamine methyltransferase
MPTVKALLGQARKTLADTETPSLDARLLLQHAMQIDHAGLVAETESLVAHDVVAKFNAMVARRAAFEPVSKILGAREFYGRAFHVTADVLDPRADTETLVDVCLALLPITLPLRILDLGTGSGILAITVLSERQAASGVAVDVSDAALNVARENAVSLHVDQRLQFRKSDWFSDVEGAFNLIVSNPPYIPAGDVPGLDIEVRDHDPHLALAGGDDGLACYRAIAAGAAAHLVAAGYIVVEIGAGQASDVTQIFSLQGFQLLQQQMDLGGHIRCLAFQKQL